MFHVPVISYESVSRFWQIPRQVYILFAVLDSSPISCYKFSPLWSKIADFKPNCSKRYTSDFPMALLVTAIEWIYAMRRGGGWKKEKERRGSNYIQKRTYSHVGVIEVCTNCKQSIPDLTKKERKRLILFCGKCLFSVRDIYNSDSLEIFRK